MRYKAKKGVCDLRVTESELQHLRDVVAVHIQLNDQERRITHPVISTLSRTLTQAMDETVKLGQT
jgi:hypothetical protein